MQQVKWKNNWIIYLGGDKHLINVDRARVCYSYFIVSKTDDDAAAKLYYLLLLFSLHYMLVHIQLSANCLFSFKFAHWNFEQSISV